MHTRTPPIASYFLALVCLALFVTSTMSACNQGQRQDTIHASFVALDAARNDFIPWDAKHQKEIVDAAATRAESDAKLAQYRQTQATIANGFVVAYRALALAGSQNDDPSLATAILDAEKLVDSIRALMGGK